MLFGAVAQNVTQTTLSSRTEVSESRNLLKEWSQLSRLDRLPTVHKTFEVSPGISE